MQIYDTQPIDPKDVPSHPHRRSLWIQAELKKRGYSLRGLSIAHGYSVNYVAVALVKPMLPAEEILANALGVTPADLFPENYDRKGQRIRRTVANSTNPRTPGNVKNRSVA